MAQSYFYPPSGGGSNPSVGPNGQPIPLQATLIAGEDPSGDLTPVAVSSSGAVIVDNLTPASVVTVVQPDGTLLHATIDASALPSGAATSANQATEITSLSSIDGKIVHVDTGNVTVVSSALPTGAATASNQSTGNASLASIDSKLTSPTTVTGPLTDTQLRASAVPVSLASSPLPTGAATATNQVTGNNSLASIDGKTVHVDTGNVTVAASALPTGAATSAKQPAFGTFGVPSPDVLTVQGTVSMTPLLVDGSGHIQPVSGTVTAIQASGTNLHVNVDASALPTGAATETTLQAISDQLPVTPGQTISAGSLAVVIASDQSSIPVSSAGSVPLAFNRTVYSSTPVTTSSWSVLFSPGSVSANVNRMEIFDSSGQTIIVGYGPTGSEVNEFLIYPGGNGNIPVFVPSGTQISLMALSATANTGEIVVNLYT